MNWQQVRDLHPDSWVVLEAISTYSLNGEYVIETMSVHGVFGDDWQTAWEHYKSLRDDDKTREYLVIHTSRNEMNIGILDTFGRKAQ